MATTWEEKVKNNMISNFSPLISNLVSQKEKGKRHLSEMNKQAFNYSMQGNHKLDVINLENNILK